MLTLPQGVRGFVFGLVIIVLDPSLKCGLYLHYSRVETGSSILILNITPLKAKRKLELLFNFIVTFLINFMCCYR